MCPTTGPFKKNSEGKKVNKMFPRNQDVCFNLYIHVIKQNN